jgi:hypothetical protein
MDRPVPDARRRPVIPVLISRREPVVETASFLSDIDPIDVRGEQAFDRAAMVMK